MSASASSATSLRAKTRDSDQVFGAATRWPFLAAARIKKARASGPRRALTSERRFPWGPPNLVAGEESGNRRRGRRSDSGSRRRRHRNRPQQKPSGPWTMSAAARPGLDHAGLVVGELQGEHRLPGRRIVRGKKRFSTCPDQAGLRHRRQHGDLPPAQTGRRREWRDARSANITNARHELLPRPMRHFPGQQHDWRPSVAPATKGTWEGGTWAKPATARARAITPCAQRRFRHMHAKTGCREAPPSRQALRPPSGEAAPLHCKSR